jgi:uncharacterized protein (TIGR03435 family)
MTSLSRACHLMLDWTGQHDQAVVSDRGEELRGLLEDRLGLRLERRKAPIKVLIVDHAEKTSRGN